MSWSVPPSLLNKQSISEHLIFDLFLSEQVEPGHFAREHSFVERGYSSYVAENTWKFVWWRLSKNFYFLYLQDSALKSDLIWLIHFQQDDSDSFTTSMCKCVNVLPGTLFLTRWTFIVFSQFEFMFNLRHSLQFLLPGSPTAAPRL